MISAYPYLPFNFTHLFLGYIGKDIRVYGDWLPRQLLGKGTALCGMVRMIYLAMLVIILYWSRVDVVVLDGISAPIPLLRLFGFKVLFYCHFPDLLLCTDRRSWWKQLYRICIDRLEEWSTGLSTAILVNSRFTLEVFEQTFPSVSRSKPPSVLYPAIEGMQEADLPTHPLSHTPYCRGYDVVFLSLNRFERKKNIGLAIASLKHLSSSLKHLSSSRRDTSAVSDDDDPSPAAVRVLLVIAGGYDQSLRENIEYLEELFAVCRENDLSYEYVDKYLCYSSDEDEEIVVTHDSHAAGADVHVVFRTSIPSIERSALLMQAVGLLYTPDREHFGIVPIEAMSLGVPVIAVNSGGPRETVLHEETGFLCDQSPEDFAAAMQRLVRDKYSYSCPVGPGGGGSKLDVMRECARRHVLDRFSHDSMRTALQTIMDSLSS
jgi:alpha-1,3/alpha-1,6-mannosyltransferase